MEFFLDSRFFEIRRLVVLFLNVQYSKQRINNIQIEIYTTKFRKNLPVSSDKSAAAFGIGALATGNTNCPTRHLVKKSVASIKVNTLK